jgi:bifunctional non-homologous end joining protein LigD
MPGPPSIAVPPRRLPLPVFRPFQLATLASRVPKGTGWLFELKFDGYRCQAAISDKAVRLYSRSGLDWTDKFARLLPPLKKLTTGTLLIDGEVCAIDNENRTSFSLLKRALGSGGPIVFFAFDLLESNGKDLAPLPLIKRKARLERVIGQHDLLSPLQFSAHVEGHGAEVFQTVCDGGHEGVVAKRAEATYRVGERALSWLKIKCRLCQEFVIVGWRAPDYGEGIASLLLGTYENGELVYRGRVRTGFTYKTLVDLRRQLGPFRRATSPLVKIPMGLGKAARWVEPVMVAEVAYSGLTPNGLLQRPTFKGIREERNPEEVTLEQPQDLEGDR